MALCGCEMITDNVKVYIIILQYNNWQDTIDCLKSVIKSSYENYQIVLIDNKSSNDAYGKLKEWLFENRCLSCKIAESILIESQVNGGYAAGNNIGIKYAIKNGDYKYVWILNNDTIIEKDALSHLVDAADKNGHVGILGSKLMYYDMPQKIQSVGASYNAFWGNIINNDNPLKKSRIDAVTGASFFISKRCIQNVGLLPEEYFLYLEESDYCLNAKRHGFIIDVAMDSIVYHKEGGSTGGSFNYKNRNKDADLLCLKNRLILANKYSGNLIGVYLGLLLSAVMRIVRGDPLQALAIFKIIARDISSYL